MKKIIILITFLIFNINLIMGEEIITNKNVSFINDKLKKEIHNNYLGLKIGYQFSDESAEKEDSYEYWLYRNNMALSLFCDINAGRGFGATFEIGYKVLNSYYSFYAYKYGTSPPSEMSYSTSRLELYEDYTIEQSLFTIDMLLRGGFKKIGEVLDYVGVGMKVAIRGTPTFKGEYEDWTTDPRTVINREFSNDEYSEVDFGMYLSFGRRTILSEGIKFLVPFNINVGLWFTPGFSEVTGDWGGYFFELKLGAGIAI